MRQNVQFRVIYVAKFNEFCHSARLSYIHMDAKAKKSSLSLSLPLFSPSLDFTLLSIYPIMRKFSKEVIRSITMR